MSFSEEKVQQVWEKAATVENNDPKQWRKDQCGAWIYRGAYGNRNSARVPWQQAEHGNELVFKHTFENIEIYQSIGWVWIPK